MTKTADLILEILCEEIPSRMQFHAAESFKNAFVQKLNDYGFTSGDGQCLITPRRISLHVKDIPTEQADRYEEKRGPRVGAPEQAIQGFLASSELTSLDECEKRTSDKGEFWFATKFIKGMQTKSVLPEIISEVIKGFTWQKSMRWGRNSLLWVRPIRSIMAIFDHAAVEGHLDLGTDMISFTDKTVGHRFMSSGELAPENYAQYRQLLTDHFVMLDQVERRKYIQSALEMLAQKHDLKVRHDDALLDEVTGLIEWPTPLLGQIDPAYMNLPEDVLITSMRIHQRYFALEDKDGKLAPHFILVANVVPKDGGAAILTGNERVLRARLSDAQFFYEQDLRLPLEKHNAGLANAIFQEDLGTMADKVSRMELLATYLAKHLNLNEADTLRAAHLSKADLTTQMVGEFPELQGIMGYYYALAEGESREIAEALADQYKPKGFSDTLPRSAIGCVVALSDKIDSMVGFFAIGIKPTGSKDPYALRRSSIGSIRLMEKLGGIQMDALIEQAYEGFATTFAQSKAKAETLETVKQELKSFFFDRLKAYWREMGIRHDYLDAVFAVAENDAFEIIAKRVHALNTFLNRDDQMGEKLLAAYRRASNIVRIEEKKDGVIFDSNVIPEHLEDPAETALYNILKDSQDSIRQDIEHHDFQKVMAALSTLRPHIDTFFEVVTVNASNSNLRENRLKLLSMIRSTLNQVSDFSKIEG